MVELEFMIPNLFLLCKCLGFSDISADSNKLTFYTKKGRVLMAAGDNVRVIVDTAINVDKKIDVSVDCKKFIEYINYIKRFGTGGMCSIVLNDEALQIKDKSSDKIKNYLYLEYITELVPKMQLVNFDKIVSITPTLAKEGLLFASSAADTSTNYSFSTSGVLFETIENILYFAGTDGVRCCIFNTDLLLDNQCKFMIPSKSARAVASIALVLDKAMSVELAKTYFKFCFGNVAVYTPKLNTEAPPILDLLNNSGTEIAVERDTFINMLRGVNIAAKKLMDNQASLSVVDNILRVSSDGFDSSFNIGDSPKCNLDVSLNMLFLHNICSLFKTKELIVKINKNTPIIITDDLRKKVAFLSLLRGM